MNKGFTLIEIIVSVGIFAIVMTVALGALLSINVANQRAQAVRIVIDNVNFALDSMAREMRLGSNYHCGTDITPGAEISFSTANCSGAGLTGIAFVSSQQTQIQYRLGSAATSPCPTGAICVSEGESGFSALTSPEVAATGLSFVVTGTGSDDKQPQVILSVSGTASVESSKVPADFKIQTTVTQRRVEINE